MSQLTKITDKNSSISIVFEKVKDKFDKLCSGLIENIAYEQAISSERLEKFSKYTTFFLKVGFIPNGENFGHLNKLLLEYWEYDMPKEDNRKRGCSYIQLYQMLIMLRQKNNERKSEYFAHSEAMKWKYDGFIIKKIKESPGITFKKLLEKSERSPKDLSMQIEIIRNKNFIVSRRDGISQYYRLTDLGKHFYKNVCLETYNVWLDQWDYKRTFVLVALMQGFNKMGKQLLMNDLVNFISIQNKAEIDDMYNEIYKFYVDRIIARSKLSFQRTESLTYNDFDTSQILSSRFVHDSDIQECEFSEEYQEVF